MTAVRDDNLLRWFARLGTKSFNLLHNIHALDDIAEDNVPSIEPRCFHSGDEELRAVGVGASVGHGEDTGASVLQDEVLVGEFLAINGFATSAIVVCEVTSLEHEVGDHTVEGGALVTEALLACTQRAEVFTGLGGDIRSQLNNDSPKSRSIGSNVHENTWQRHYDGLQENANLF